MTGTYDPNESGDSPLAAYRIELERFQGPLDLLLHLIRKNEVDIHDIPIAEITRQYLQYLEIMEEMQQKYPRQDPRNRLIHCTVVNPELVAKIKELEAKCEKEST